MSWKELRNGEPDTVPIKHSGDCPYTGELAEVTSIFKGKVEGKADSRKTYRFKGYKCTLQKDAGCPNPACMDVCRLIQKEY